MENVLNSCCRIRAGAVSFLLLIAFLAIPAGVTADNFVGGIPLVTVQSGDVTGDLYIDATPPDWQGQGVSDIVKTFTLPETALGNITWARLYVSAYCGNMQGDRDIYVLNQWDGDGVNGYEQVWNETGHAEFIYIINGGNNNSAFSGHGIGEPYLMINDHETRVTSDYLMQYDVKGLIKNQTIFLNVRTAGSYDGRTKVATLVVAYDNPQSTILTRYWVNEGHDVDSYYTEDNLGEVAVGSTTFGTKGAGSFSSACLTINYMASHIGVFGFPGMANDQDAEVPSITFAQPLATGTDIQGPYSGVMHWNVTSSISGKTNVTLAHARDVSQTGLSAFFKIPLAVLVLKSPLAPVAGFTVNVTDGPAPLTVRFTDTATGGLPSSWNWSFGDGATSAEQNPEHTFSSAGTYTVTLTVSNSGGSNSTTKTDYITVTAPTVAPVAGFAANVTNGTAPLTVVFSDNSANNPTNWNWSFGDGNVSSLRNPVHTYAFAGDFTVTLNATNAIGSNTTSRSDYITVHKALFIPLADFTADVTSGTAPLNVTFTDVSTNIPSSWIWDFGDGDATNATEQNPVHSYAAAGIYTVNLTVANNDGSDSEVRNDFITVTSGSGAPTAAFSAVPTTGTAPLTVQFTDDSTGSVTGWMWDFGDGNTTGAADQNPVHTYLAPGTYTVTLTASNDNGSDEETRKNYIAVTIPASDTTAISLTPQTQSIAVGDTATFQVVADSLPEGVAGYDLVVSLSNASVATISSVTYPSWGNSRTVTPLPNSSVWLSALDSALVYQNGASNVVLATITVAGNSTGITPLVISDVAMDPDGGGDAIAVAVSGSKAVVGSYAGPVADFTANATYGPVPLAVRFIEASTGSPVSFAWDFNNDGTVDSTDQDPEVVTYAAAGTYSVNLTVADAAGVTDTTVRTNYITAGSVPVPIVAFTATPLSGNVPLTVRFTDLSGNSPTAWVWDFGDGNSTNATAQNPVHTYLSSGTYSVSLTATNAGGSNTTVLNGYVRTTVSGTLDIPVASFTADTTEGAAPLAVKFTDTSTGDPTSWSWDFGDGNTSVLQNPSHTFPAGTYSTTLTVANEDGSDTVSATITVTTASGVPGIAFTGTPVSGTAPLTVTFTDKSSGSPVSWKWDFGDGNSSTSQNPTHKYPYSGSFPVSLTATNSKGSDSLTKSDYISVTASSTPPNLYVYTIVPNFGGVAGGNVFAMEKNPVTINIKNSGTGESGETTVKLTSSDGFSGTATVPAIAAGSYTTVTITDTKDRISAGSSITYTAVADPGNLISESSESDNSRTTSSITTKYNGYKGKRYWSGGGDVKTKHTFDINGSLIYSRGDSVYRSGSFGDDGWLSYTVTWDEDEFDKIPSDADIKAVYLYVPYTWDSQNIAPDHTFVKFNGDTVSRSNWYSDKSNFGTYADYAYGLLVYDVTSKFDEDEENKAVFTRENPNYDDDDEAAVYTKISMYEFYLVVVYADEDEPERLIFINEGFDLLGASDDYGTTEDEATAYVPFTGLTIPKAQVSYAKLITFVPSGDSDEGNLYYNGEKIASDVWDYGSSGTGVDGIPQIAVDVRSVTQYVGTSNVVAIQSTDDNGDTPCMAAAQQILIITLNDDDGDDDDDDDTSSSGTSASTSSAVVSSSASSGVLTSIQETGTSPRADVSLPATSGSPVADRTTLKSQLAPSPGSNESAASSESASPPSEDIPWIPSAIFVTAALIGTTGVVGYRAGWFPMGVTPVRQEGTRIFCDGGADSASCLSLDSMSGIISVSSQKKPMMILPAFSLPDTRRLMVILVVALCMLAATTVFWFPASPSAASISSVNHGAGTFDLIPTIENIEDLDRTNHVPDYPAGFSARNGILLVYSGQEPHSLTGLRLTLAKGSVEIALDGTAVPPVENAVGPDFASYLAEEGNGNGILENGEWLMVYADGCYDSSSSDTEPKGAVLTWQPQDAVSVLELPVKDSVIYRLEDTGTGSILQEGTLLFVPAT